MAKHDKSDDSGDSDYAPRSASRSKKARPTPKAKRVRTTSTKTESTPRPAPLQLQQPSGAIAAPQPGPVVAKDEELRRDSHFSAAHSPLNQPLPSPAFSPHFSQNDFVQDAQLAAFRQRQMLLQQPPHLHQPRWPSSHGLPMSPITPQSPFFGHPNAAGAVVRHPLQHPNHVPMPPPTYGLRQLPPLQASRLPASDTFYDPSRTSEIHVEQSFKNDSAVAVSSESAGQAVGAVLNIPSPTTKLGASATSEEVIAVATFGTSSRDAQPGTRQQASQMARSLPSHSQALPENTLHSMQQPQQTSLSNVSRSFIRGGDESLADVYQDDGALFHSTQQASKADTSSALAAYTPYLHKNTIALHNDASWPSGTSSGFEQPLHQSNRIAFNSWPQQNQQGSFVSTTTAGQRQLIHVEQPRNVSMNQHRQRAEHGAETHGVVNQAPNWGNGQCFANVNHIQVQTPQYLSPAQLSHQQRQQFHDARQQPFPQQFPQQQWQQPVRETDQEHVVSQPQDAQMSAHESNEQVLPAVGRHGEVSMLAPATEGIVQEASKSSSPASGIDSAVPSPPELPTATGGAGPKLELKQESQSSEPEVHEFAPEEVLTLPPHAPPFAEPFATSLPENHHGPTPYTTTGNLRHDDEMLKVHMNYTRRGLDRGHTSRDTADLWLYILRLFFPTSEGFMYATRGYNEQTSHDFHDTVPGGSVILITVHLAATQWNARQNRLMVTGAVPVISVFCASAETALTEFSGVRHLQLTTDHFATSSIQKALHKHLVKTLLEHNNAARTGQISVAELKSFMGAIACGTEVWMLGIKAVVKAEGKGGGEGWLKGATPKAIDLQNGTPSSSLGVVEKVLAKLKETVLK